MNYECRIMNFEWCQLTLAFGFVPVLILNSILDIRYSLFIWAFPGALPRTPLHFFVLIQRNEAKKNQGRNWIPEKLRCGDLTRKQIFAASGKSEFSWGEIRRISPAFARSPSLVFLRNPVMPKVPAKPAYGFIPVLPSFLNPIRRIFPFYHTITQYIMIFFFSLIATPRENPSSHFFNNIFLLMISESGIWILGSDSRTYMSKSLGNPDSVEISRKLLLLKSGIGYLLM